MSRDDPKAGDVRAQLRALKGAKQWINKVLAEHAEVNQEQISRFLRDDVDMPLRRVEKMLAGLGYRLSIEKIKEQE